MLIRERTYNIAEDEQCEFITFILVFGYLHALHRFAGGPHNKLFIQNIQ